MTLLCKMLVNIKILDVKDARLVPLSELDMNAQYVLNLIIVVSAKRTCLINIAS